MRDGYSARVGECPLRLRLFKARDCARSLLSWFLPKLVGVSTALEWTYSGRIFGADEAKERGFVRSVHSAETLLDEAQALAREFATQTSSISVAMARHMMWRLPSADHPMEAHKIDSRGVYFTGKSADAREGVQSFLEKRPAEFPGNVSTDMPEFFPGGRLESSNSQINDASLLRAFMPNKFDAF